MDYLRQTVEELEEKAQKITDALLFKEAYLTAISGLMPRYTLNDKYEGSNADWICDAAFDIAQETVNLFKQYKDKQ